MSSHNESILREPLVTGRDITYAKVTADILVPVENKPNTLRAASRQRALF